MTLKDKIKIFFGGGKNRFLRVRINHEDKTTQTMYVKRDGKDAVMTKDGYYKIDPENVYDEEGFKTLSYNHKDPIPIDYLAFEREMDKLTAQKLKSGMEERITRHIIESVEDENKQDSVLKIAIIVMVIGLGGLGFFVYDQFTTVMETLNEQQKVIEALRDFISEGGAD